MQITSDSRTLIAGAAAVDIHTTPGPSGISGISDWGVAVHVAIKAHNTSALTAASVTLLAQYELNGSGTWTDAGSLTVDMPVGSAVAGDKHASFIDMPREPLGAGATSIDVRVRASCTGANVMLDTTCHIFDPNQV